MSETTHQDLINIIVNDNRYKSICKQLTGKQTHLADDLYQTTMEQLLIIKDNRLVDAFNGEYLEVYIIGIANKLWNKRWQVKYHEDGSTSDLLEYSSTVNVTEAHDFVDTVREVRAKINQTSLDYDPKADQVFEATKKIVKKDCDSQTMDIRYMARVYNYSNNNIAGLKDMEACPNARQFAAQSGINYMAVSKTCRKYRERIKDKLKHLLND